MSRPQLRPPALQAAVAASSPLLLGIAGCAVTRARGHWRDRSLCGKRKKEIAMVAVTIVIIDAVAIAIAIAIIVAIATITVTEIDNALDN